jgi:hypothetical protein
MDALSLTLPVLLAIAMFATVGALMTGLVSMLVGGDFNARWSNRLMRARVTLQGVALVLFATLLLVSGVS